MFLLLKILLFFFRPVVWIAIIFITAFFVRNEKRKRRLFVWGAALVLFFSNPFVIRILLKYYETPPEDMHTLGTYPAGIVLGGFVSYNIHEDKAYFNTSSDRFIETALLYKTGHIRKIIVAAGNGYMVKHHFREADFVKLRLMELGIPDSAIYTDPDSKNTLQNAQDSKKIIDSTHTSGPFLLISSALHLPRAERAFKKLGIPVHPFACDFLARGVGNNFVEDYILPSSSALVFWDLYIKELVGLMTYKITGRG
jgi:uncharacterized SAM-binding protein YcdF (DUF218 family)